MKKFLFIIVLALAFLLVSCTTTKEASSSLIDANIAEEKDSNSDEEQALSIVEEERTPGVILDFNYAYGVKNMRELKENSISIISSYFSRGLYDAYLSPYSPVLMKYDDLERSIDEYITEYYVNGISFEKGDRQSDISSLSPPVTLEERFSYAYGYIIARDLILEEFDIVIEPFTKGMIDELYDDAILSDDDITYAINSYILYLNEEYYLSLEKLKEENIRKAEEFFAANGEKPGITTLNNGVEILILDQDETLGERPTQYDTVIMDYNEYILNTQTGVLEYTDAAYNVEVSLITLPNGLLSAINNMKVGMAIRAYVPPELSRLPEGDEDIPPYSIFVYDIALHEIL